MNAIIVDDEDIVRHGLRFHYHWSKYDIHILGDFADGMSALKFLENNSVELLITDVVMPRLNGLELAQKARVLNPELKIIFISGYADVNYLSDALRMNAVDYIFKSIDFDALDAAIERVANFVHQRNSELQYQKWLEDQLRQNREVLRQQRLVSLLTDTEEPEEAIANTCTTLSLSLNSQSLYVVMVIHISNRWSLLTQKENTQSDVLLDLTLQKAIQDCLDRRSNAELFKKKAYEYICLVNTDVEEYEDMLLTVSTEIQTQLKHRFGAEIEIGISQRFRGLRNIRTAYKNACDAIYNRYVLDDSIPDIAMSKYPSESSLISLRDKMKSEIGNSLLSGDPEQIQRTVLRCTSAIRALASVEEQQNQMIYILLLPQKLLRDIPLRSRACYSSHRKLLEQFFMLNRLDEQEEFLIRVYTEASAVLMDNNTLQNNSIVKKVIAYIDTHYMEALSIEGIAESVYLTPTYLCVLFKKNTGKTINNYLTEVRLEKARELLSRDNLHLQDICYRVGYLSPSYFSRLFRKYYGMSPSEYRDSLIHE